jgi:hypothetical protein
MCSCPAGLKPAGPLCDNAGASRATCTMNNGNDGNACWSQTCWHMFTNMVIIVNDVAAPFQPHVLLISNHPCSHENLQKPAANDAASAAAALKTLVDIEELSVPHCETMSVYSTSTPHDRSEGQAVLGPFWQSEHVSACAAQSVRVGSTHFHGRRHQYERDVHKHHGEAASERCCRPRLAVRCRRCHRHPRCVTQHA